MKIDPGSCPNDRRARCANGAIHTSLGQRPRFVVENEPRAESPCQPRFTENGTGFQPSPSFSSGSWGVAPGWYGAGPSALLFRLSLRISGLFIFAVSLCTAEPPKKTDDIPPCCRAPFAAGKPTDRSLYQLESNWTSDVGRKVKLSVLRGRPQVLAMFFSHCEYACPILVNDMKKLEAALPGDVRAKVDFLLVSFDTKRDTPEALAAYRRKEKLATGRWTLLRGEADDVRELAALLGVNYAQDARGQFAHSNIITLLNAEGEIAFQHNGLNQDPSALLRAIANAAAKSVR